MSEKIVSDALHDWETTLAKINAAQDALLDFLNEIDPKTPNINTAFCIAHTLELAHQEGYRAFDIVNKVKAG